MNSRKPSLAGSVENNTACLPACVRACTVNINDDSIYDAFQFFIFFPPQNPDYTLHTVHPKTEFK